MEDKQKTDQHNKKYLIEVTFKKTSNKKNTYALYIIYG